MRHSLIATSIAHQLQTESGTGTGVDGISVDTETCGQVIPSKFMNTTWENWICVEVTLIVLGEVISYGGLTRNTGRGWPDSDSGAEISIGACPGLKTGTVREYPTVSIQKVACIWGTFAFGAVAPGLPNKNAMFAVPPPNSGRRGFVDTVKIWSG
jgi:hypothetical protein